MSNQAHPFGAKVCLFLAEEDFRFSKKSEEMRNQKKILKVLLNDIQILLSTWKAPETHRFLEISPQQHKHVFKLPERVCFCLFIFTEVAFKTLTDKRKKKKASSFSRLTQDTSHPNFLTKSRKHTRKGLLAFSKDKRGFKRVRPVFFSFFFYFWIFNKLLIFSF